MRRRRNLIQRPQNKHFDIWPRQRLNFELRILGTVGHDGSPGRVARDQPGNKHTDKRGFEPSFATRAGIEIRRSATLVLTSGYLGADPSHR